MHGQIGQRVDEADRVRVGEQPGLRLERLRDLMLATELCD
jgi:hypothetical protein